MDWLLSGVRVRYTAASKLTAWVFSAFCVQHLKAVLKAIVILKEIYTGEPQD